MSRTSSHSREITHSLERRQSSDATCVRPNNLEVRELERKAHDGRVDLTLRCADGFGQAEVRKYTEPPRLLGRGLGNGSGGCFGILSVDRLRTWSRRCLGGLHALLLGRCAVRGRRRGALLHVVRSLAIDPIWGPGLPRSLGRTLLVLELAAFVPRHLLLGFLLTDMRDVAVGRRLDLGVQGRSGGHGGGEKRLRLRKNGWTDREDMFCRSWDWRVTRVMH